MKKLCLFFSLVLCCLAQNSYAQGYDANCYDNNVASSGTEAVSDGGCPPERAVGDCYCMYCRYEPRYYTVRRCEYCPQYTYKKCCRYVPQYYQQTCCRYVPQYYCKTCCKYVPQYYTVPECKYVPKYHSERRCTYVPRYYYKHTNCPTGGCGQQSCAPEYSAPSYGSEGGCPTGCPSAQYGGSYAPAVGGGCPSAGGYGNDQFQGQFQGQMYDGNVDAGNIDNR